jgi:hypothetical protein
MCTLEELKNVIADVEKDVKARLAKGEKGCLNGTGILADAMVAMRLNCEPCKRKHNWDFESNALKRRFCSYYYEREKKAMIDSQAN